jgi:hypothetical protein
MNKGEKRIGKGQGKGKGIEKEKEMSIIFNRFSTGNIYILTPLPLFNIIIHPSLPGLFYTRARFRILSMVDSLP